MEYEHFYYDLAGQEDRWQEFPLKNLIEYLRRRIKPGSRILDIGCGTASVLKFLPRTVYYTGLNQSEFAIEKAKRTWVSFPMLIFGAYGASSAIWRREF